MTIEEIPDDLLKQVEGGPGREDPLVSVVIPCRNERGRIGACLDALLVNEFPKDKLEILVVDGMSDDNTRGLLSEYTEKFPCIQCLINPERVTPVAMNTGIRKAVGDVIILLNAHSIVDRHFLRTSVDSLRQTGADAGGGTLRTINEGDGIICQAIPLAADSVFGAGGKRYRTRTTAGWVRDTLPYAGARLRTP